MQERDTRDEQIRRLLLWNEIWATLLCVLLIVGAAFLWARYQLEERHHALTLSWDGADVRLYAGSDGPFVVTHLVRYGDGVTVDTAVAALPEPLAIMSSGGRRIPASVMQQFVWRSTRSDEQVAGPPAGAPLRAFYYRPRVAQFPPNR
jgi:hypothetical protein